jgi:hypothetical protein
VTLSRVADHADGDFAIWLRDRKNYKKVGYRFEVCGYAAGRNQNVKDGLWNSATSARRSVAAQQLAERRG